ncbi:unnamed protein product [Urochloa decumbens]|uniref:Uncharacterized protein n=1 Tax=Urochloa decumbens TaxID=240449 RepID=A0ABC9B7L9_9POAL
MSAQPDSRPPAAAVAGASSRSGGRALAWAILERIPTFVDAAELPGDAKYSSKLAAPPGVSTLLISREVLPAGAESGRVECADGEGNLLVSLRSASAQGGGGRLLVCLPGNGSGEARLLPEVPAHLGVGLDFGLDSCFGIVSAAAPRPGGCGFVVVQLQRAAPSSAPSSSSSASSAARHRAISFCSWTWSWETIDVAPEGEANVVDMEQPHTAVSNDSRYEIVFLDIKRGILAVHSPGAATARFIPFPSPAAHEDYEYHAATMEAGQGHQAAAEEDLQVAASRRAVACSGGNVLLAEVTRDGHWVSMKRLEEEDRWVTVFRVSTGEAFDITDELVERLHRFHAPPPGLGPVDPADCTRLTFYSPHAAIAFTVRVDPGDITLSRVKEADATSRGSCLDLVVWRFAAASRSKAELIREAAGKAKVVGVKAIKMYRDNAEVLTPVAHAVGSAIAGPFGAAVVATADTLATGNSALGIGENVAKKVGMMHPSGSKTMDIKVVENVKDARRVIRAWKRSGEPNNMRVQTAPGLNEEEVNDLRFFFRGQDAEALLPEHVDVSAYDMVPRPVNF